MVTCEISLNTNEVTEEEKQHFIDDVDTLLKVLRRNGQIINKDNTFLFENRQVRLFVSCPDKHSLDVKYNNKYVDEWKTKLKEVYKAEVEWRWVADYPFKANGSFISSKAFILYWGGYSPLRSFDSFDPIPLYEFPNTYKDGHSYNDIMSWQDNYEAIYGIWNRGEIDERKFYNYLSSIRSPVSKAGLDICRKIEELTKKDCYFYLFNYNSERPFKKCPSCKGNWNLSTKMFEEFDLRCDKCKIISNTRIDK